MTDRDYMAKLLDDVADLLGDDFLARPVRGEHRRLSKSWHPPSLGSALSHECFKDAQSGTSEARALANLQLYEWYRAKASTSVRVPRH